MSQIADITVYDGAATPVSHVLKAISVTRDPALGISAEWREMLVSLPTEAQVRLTITQKKLKSGVIKVEQRMVVPVMESVSGQNAAGYTAPPKVAYENTFVQTGYFHPRSDIAGRRLVRQLALNVGGNISTSVAAATTGFAPDAFDSLICPS